MIVTIYDDITKTTADKAKHYEVSEVLSWIANCNYGSQIDAIRAEKDKVKNSALKAKLPCLVVSGKFLDRFDDLMILSSGLCILDFDHLADVNETKEYMKTFNFVYSAFISPNGDGLKVIVRIPLFVKKFRGYYRALLALFPQLDPTNINESRVCYLSADKDIYINENAVEFTEFKEEKVYQRQPIQASEIKINDENKIIKNLFTWWEKKFPMVSGSRNHNIFVLACAFNEYGISKFEAESICTQYAQSDFTVDEITKSVSSAYRKTALHGTKEFSLNSNFNNYIPREVPLPREENQQQPEENKPKTIKDIINSAFIDVKKNIPFPPMALSIGELHKATTLHHIPFGTFGNFSCIVGASKSKKTFLKSLLTATFLGKPNLNSLIKTHRKRDMFVIDIDTEQGEYHAQSVAKRVSKITNEFSDFYKPYAFRPFSAKERVEYIEYLIYESDFKDNIGLVCLDGIADLVEDFNDLKESSAIIQKVMKWTDDKQFHLIAVIHQNSTTEKATGHLGSSILKKAETVCNLKNDDDIVTVSFPYTRGYPIEKFEFSVDDNWLPYVIGEQNVANVVSQPKPIQPNTEFDKPIMPTRNMRDEANYNKEEKKDLITSETFKPKGEELF